MSDSPPEKDVQWSDEGIVAAHKFVQKLWNLNLKILEQTKTNNPKSSNGNLEKITNNFIKNVSNNLNNFSYNKIIANFHEIYSDLIKEIKNEYSKDELIKNYKKILIVMTPVLPHFAFESLDLLNENSKIIWPEINEELLLEKNINYVVQINGKKRGLIKAKREISVNELIDIVNNDLDLKKYLENRELKKKIFIPNKLINIII